MASSALVSSSAFAPVSPEFSVIVKAVLVAVDLSICDSAVLRSVSLPTLNELAIRSSQPNFETASLRLSSFAPASLRRPGKVARKIPTCLYCPPQPACSASRQCFGLRVSDQTDRAGMTDQSKRSNRLEQRAAARQLSLA